MPRGLLLQQHLPGQRLENATKPPLENMQRDEGVGVWCLVLFLDAIGASGTSFVFGFWLLLTGF
jgi:hypothetical protein